MYQLKTNLINGQTLITIIRNNVDGSVTSFGYYLDNSDYINFKLEVLSGAELQDADGNVMTQEQAKDYVKELP